VYIATYNSPSFAQKVVFYDMESIQTLLKNGKSIIRLGDGEIQLLLGRPMPYDIPNANLRRKLIAIIKQYKRQSKYILAIPQKIVTPNSILVEESLKRIWLPFKVIYFLLFPKKVSYMDALSFRPEFDQGMFSEIVAPFLADKHVIFVTRKETIERIKETNHMLEKPSFIITDEKNTFSKYRSIKQNILNRIDPVNKQNTVVLFALGPAAKVLVWELSEEGVQCIDLGKGMEFIFA